MSCSCCGKGPDNQVIGISNIKDKQVVVKIARKNLQIQNRGCITNMPINYCPVCGSLLPDNDEEEPCVQSCSNCARRVGRVCTAWETTFQSDVAIRLFDAYNCVFWALKENN